MGHYFNSVINATALLSGAVIVMVHIRKIRLKISHSVKRIRITKKTTKQEYIT